MKKYRPVMTMAQWNEKQVLKRTKIKYVLAVIVAYCTGSIVGFLITKIM